MAYRQRTGMTTATQSVLMDDPDFLRLIVERVVQAILEADAAQRAPAAHLHAEPYERNAERRGYRNGYKPRMLTRASAHSRCRCHRIGTAPSRRSFSRATNAARRRSCSR